MVSHLAKELLRLFAKGEIVGTQVQLLASAANRDGVGRGCELLRDLGKAGNEGRIGGHIVRDIMRAAAKAGLMNGPQPYTVDLPHGKGTLGMLLPHEIYHDLVLGTRLEDWCLTPAELAGDECGRLLRQWAEEPDVQFDGDLATVAMLGLHCDGVAYTTTNRAGGTKSILVCSINAISPAHEPLRWRRMPLFVLHKSKYCPCGCGGYHTMQELMGVVAWSFQVLLEGRAPGERHNGDPWTSTDRLNRLPAGTAIPHAALLQIRGDWEWRADAKPVNAHPLIPIVVLCKSGSDLSVGSEAAATCCNGSCKQDL
jgi:hypothetical protein